MLTPSIYDRITRLSSDGIISPRSHLKILCGVLNPSLDCNSDVDIFLDLMIDLIFAPVADGLIVGALYIKITFFRVK